MKKIISIMRSRDQMVKEYTKIMKKITHIKLFHTRLSIIDPLKRSHQPLDDNEGVLTLKYDL